MSLMDLIFLALGVSLDSFAICICKGITAKNRLKMATWCAISFSVFQFLMPLLGFYVGSLFNDFLGNFDHYIVFFIFFCFGINMFKEAFSKEEKVEKSSPLSIILLALISSLDSLGVGVSVALFEGQILTTSLILFGLTFFVSFVGVLIGKFIGKKHKKIACIVGGVILLILSIKILVEHIFF